MFGDLMSSIFRHGAKAEAPPDAAARTPESRVAAAARQGVPLGQGTPAAPAAPAPTLANVDVTAILDKLAASNREKLDWKHSIVDLMKLVGMDSSLTARKELADDLHYTGDKSDSAKMNMWLHKEVMRKLAENGGKVPADLLTK
jgi:hypothetical protein